MVERCKQGITLISLVITIVVLLILAGVAISVATNGNGIFTKANEAVGKWNNSLANEQAEIEKILEQLDEVTVKPMITNWNISAGDIVGIYVYDSYLNPSENNTSITIDWGDGIIENYTSSNLKYDVDKYGYVTHTYSKTNSNTKVSITGYCDVIYMDNNDKLKSIEQWGYLGCRVYNFWGCDNLATIASPEKNTFKNVTDFSSTFESCSSLTNIPPDLFANCPNVTDFSNTFSKCSSLTGNPIPLWERVENGASNGYKGIPDGGGCYYKCTGLTGYNQIPEYWKINNFES